MRRRSAIQLPAHGIWLDFVGQYDWGFVIEYRGPTIDALLAAGCIDAGMAQRFSNGRKGACRVDDDGDHFYRKKRPTKAQPERCCVMRHIRADRDHDGHRKAMALPGVAVWLAREGSEQEDTRPRLKQAAENVAKVMGATGMRERTRAVGRFRRRVSWVAIEGVVFPDWPMIRAGAIAERGVS